MKHIKNVSYTALRQSPQWSLISTHCCKLLLGTIVLTLPLTLPVNLAQAQQYTPPSGDPPKTATGSNGSRGNCQGEYDLPLVGLAPTLTNHVGQTTTTTPTLAWFIPTDQAYRIRFSLYTIDQENLLYETEYEDSTSGIITLKVPEAVGLEPDQRYLWEVNISCDLESPTYEEYFISELDVIALPADLAAALAVAPTSVEKVSLYAESGYWYDALQTALAAAEDPSLVQTLLSNLATSETGLQRQYLSQIAEIMSDSDSEGSTTK